MPYNTDISLLIVENDPTALELCRSIISMRFPKMIVHTACNPADAIAKYKDQKHEIVISDLFAPKKDGIEIAKEICAMNPTTVIIFITGDTDTHWDTLKHKAKSLCLKGIIHKPINIAEVIDKITEAISILKINIE